MKDKAKPWTDNLPEWASLNPDDGFVEVDPDVVYPLWLEKMEKLEKLDPTLKGISEKPTRHALEAARLIFTRALKAIMYAHGGKFLNLRILNKGKKEKGKRIPGKWALMNFPVGEPIDRRHVIAELGLDRVLRPKV